jgi:hypothetical protein
MTDYPAATVAALGRQRVNSAFEGVKRMAGAVKRHVERLVVVVAANFAYCHDPLLFPQQFGASSEASQADCAASCMARALDGTSRKTSSMQRRLLAAARSRRSHRVQDRRISAALRRMVVSLMMNLLKGVLYASQVCLKLSSSKFRKPHAALAHHLAAVSARRCAVRP